MIRYDRLWDTMKEKGVTQYRLIKGYGFSAGQIGRLKKNMHVSTHTLETLCTILSCRLEDIAEYVPDSMQANPDLLPSSKVSESPDIPESSPETPSSKLPDPKPEGKKSSRKNSKAKAEKGGKDKKGGKSKKGKNSKKK